MNGYSSKIDVAAGLVFVFAGVIPNDYFDEPLGYCLVGVTHSRLSSLLASFSDTTGQMTLFSDGDHPIIWSGLPGDPRDIKVATEAFTPIPGANAASTVQLPQSLKSGGGYNFCVKRMADFPVPANTSIALSAGNVLVITGEPEALISDAIESIRRQTEDTKDKVLETTLLTASLVLLLSMIVVDLIGKRISRPVTLAADMSDRIASGNLDTVLSGGGSDEIGRLITSMNFMSARIKEFREKDKERLKTIEDSKIRSERILSVIQEGLLIVDTRTNRVLEANPAAADMINAQRKDIIGDLCDNYLLWKEENQRTGSNGKELVQNMEGVLLTKNGRQKSVLRAAVPILWDARMCLLESFIDISPLKQAEMESKRLQMQLHRAQKMESLGTLAGGVAHDLNNILSGIVSYPELLLMSLAPDSPMRKSITTIKNSGEKAAAIVQDLLTMARRGVIVQHAVNLNAIVTGYMESPEYRTLKSFHSNVVVKTQLDSKLSNIMGSSIHLSKTLMNLISNAAEAMPDGGELSIRTTNLSTVVPIKGYEKIQPGEYAVLSVGDSGLGIDKENLDRIFEPFYTKKVMGRSGTGLGMAVVWGTIKDHNGYIDVKSEVEKGTTFTLYFPVTGKAPEKEGLSLPIEAYRGNRESVLVVDDTREQREIVSAILQKLNYSAISMASGEEAVEYLKFNKADVVLLDMIMEPGMDGLDTYKKMLEIHPGQKAIIVSGFSETERVREIQQLGAKKYLKKPYSIVGIGIAIKDELKK